jgi:hemerythrin-like domain-containing protein
MNSNPGLNRRQVLGAGFAGIAMTVNTLGAGAQTKLKWDPDEGVTAPEDLMKEHGVLNRCLLIYEEGVRRLRAKQEVSPAVFNHTAKLIKLFVEEYHEKNEENHIFPVFKKAGKLTDLVHTLETQHKAGRVVTGTIIRLSASDQFKSAGNRDKLVSSIHTFIRMYRPHESREDTVLFPALRTILNPKQVESLGAKMEEAEQKVLGHEGFEKSVAQVAEIEKLLGIYDLKQYTPHP